MTLGWSFWEAEARQLPSDSWSRCRRASNTSQSRGLPTFQETFIALKNGRRCTPTPARHTARFGGLLGL